MTVPTQNITQIALVCRQRMAKEERRKRTRWRRYGTDWAITWGEVEVVDVLCKRKVWVKERSNTMERELRVSV
jgi:hypothetical protein